MDMLKKQHLKSTYSSKMDTPYWSILGGAMATWSKLVLVICAACACSLIYIALQLSAAGSCQDHLHSNRFILGNVNLHAVLFNATTSTVTAPNKLLLPTGSASATSASVSSSDAPSPPSPPPPAPAATHIIPVRQLPASDRRTGLRNIVFGIAASSRLWEKRREYVKLWWNSTSMRGYVWLDKKPRRKWSAADYPPYRISGSISGFNYTNKLGSRAAIRISRIVSETFRMGLPDVHWFVMGDDDTVFIPDNLVKLLSKYDHTKYYYIGSSSESHTQNLHFSYNMAYGGGGFAISYPLAKALEKVQDGCLHRYPYLFGSDDRIQACMAELGVPLVKEPGFHQFDIYGDASGLLLAHPVSPLVTLHHLDVILPIFPNMTQVQALKHLRRAVRVDSAGVLQQSICYDKWRKWSFSVSWGYAVQVYRGILPPRELELPARTFVSWYRRTEDSGFPFSTRAVSSNPCEQPTIFYMQNVGLKGRNSSFSTYTRESRRRGDCRWRMASPVGIDGIRVYRELTDRNWYQAPRRHCCRVLNTNTNASNRKVVDIEVSPCRVGEFIA